MIWLGDIPVATLRPDSAGVALFYIHADHLNTPRKISRPADNVVVWRWDSDPFGVSAADEDPDGDGQLFGFNLRFPGQYRDGETGLNYNYFRDYDPSTGRYIESDSIGLGGGLNTYLYAEADPISKIDPTGEVAQGALGALAIGAAAMRICLKMPACKKAVHEAIKNCKDVRCRVQRERADHLFKDPIGGKNGWCVHLRVTCWIKGGSKLFEVQWPVGDCFRLKHGRGDRIQNDNGYGPFDW